MRILIAEDDLTSRTVLARLLMKEGHEVTAVVNGAEAWNALRQPGAPGRAILDWMKRGAAAYLRKPFKPDYLIELCVKARKERSLLREQDLLEVRTGELHGSEERFRLSMEATRDGLWDWNVQTDGGYFSPGYYHMLDYEPDEFPSEGNTWKDLIHPDDREHALQANMDCIEGRCDVFEVEYRMKAKNGGWRWILGRGKSI